MNYQDDVLKAAVQMAVTVHGLQKDKAGMPYIGHLERTAEMVRRSGGTWLQEAAAWLHDAIEDAPVPPAAEVILRGVLPTGVTDIVVAMTHFPKSISNAKYWAQVKACPGAVLVKLCDIHDNLDPSRLSYLSGEDQIRLRRKYAKAIQTLLA